MPINEINDFRVKQKKFLKWLPYMTKKRTEIVDIKSPEWIDIVKKFIEKVEAPMDAAWDLLSNSEKNIFLPKNKESKQTVFENCPF